MKCTATMFQPTLGIKLIHQQLQGTRRMDSQGPRRHLGISGGNVEGGESHKTFSEGKGARDYLCI